MPLIRFLYIGSYVCSTLLSDPPSSERPCASLLLHLHQVVEGTFTPELSNMLGTQRKDAPSWERPWFADEFRLERKFRDNLQRSRVTREVVGPLRELRVGRQQED